MAASTGTARLVGLGVLLGLAAACSAAQSPASGPPPRTVPQRSAVADSFRSVRDYPVVPLPVRIRVPAAGINSVLERLGRAVDGSMALPSRPERAGWYAGGPRPGQPGPAVIIGHVDWDTGPAVFFRLRQLRSGDAVYVDRADGSTARFRVTGRTEVPKNQFPTDLVYGPTLEPSLRLVTCGGGFDYSTRNYLDNVIVFAAPT